MTRMADEQLAEIGARYDTETNLEWLRNAVHKLLQALKAEREMKVYVATIEDPLDGCVFDTKVFATRERAYAWLDEPGQAETMEECPYLSARVVEHEVVE